MKNHFIIFSLILYFLSSFPVAATSLLPISLEQLSTRATLIFYGEVLSNQVKKDKRSGRIATFTKFKIIDLIKGETGDTHIIKQIGGYLKENNTKYRIHGVPEFQTGKKHIVFLPEKSNLGFSSPLGLHQGSFSVLTVNGQQITSNGRNLTAQAKKNNRNVQIPLAVSTDKPSHALLDDFINSVRAYNLP